MSTTGPTGFTEAVMAWQDDAFLVPRKYSGTLRVAWRLVRRLRQPRGHALGHPNDGKDITDNEQNTVDARSIATKRAEIHAEVLKDPSVTTAYVTVLWDAPSKTETITVRAFGAFGQVTIGLVTLADGTKSVVVS